MDQELPTLSPAEWKAVSIAINDATNRGCGAGEPGPLARLITTLTGIERPRPLADPRLETLRRFVCDTRRSRGMADQFVPALMEQGFNQAQVRAIALLAA